MMGRTEEPAVLWLVGAAKAQCLDSETSVVARADNAEPSITLSMAALITAKCVGAPCAARIP